MSLMQKTCLSMQSDFHLVELAGHAEDNPLAQVLADRLTAAAENEKDLIRLLFQASEQLPAGNPVGKLIDERIEDDLDWIFHEEYKHERVIILWSSRRVANSDT